LSPNLETAVGVGQLFLEALRLDLEPLDAVRRRIYDALALQVGGFLFFGAEADAAARLAEEILDSADRPLWLAADLERGAGQHFRGLTTFPPPAALAAHPDPGQAVREAARRTALEARSLGLNLALAPVLDLDVEAQNPIVGIRSFGADPGLVATLGGSWIEACQNEGVAACAKHFPGHGRTTADSHAELPVVDADSEALEADLQPFRAVAGNVACVMTAHVAFPALGGDGPATLEPAILGDLLRGELGFEGLILTDALNMSGARDGAAETPEVAALRAGCDLLLYPPDLAAAISAVERAADSAGRVADRLRESLGRAERVLGRFEVARGADAGSTAGDESTPAAIAAECVMPVGGAVPAWLDPSEPVTVATIWDDRQEPARPPFGEGFRAALRAAGWRVAAPGSAPDSSLIVLVASTPQAWKGTASLTLTGQAAFEGALARERAFPVVFGHARLLAGVDRPGLCAWATEPAMETAAARRLDGLVRGTE
jgi:beta-glucosidase